MFNSAESGQIVLHQRIRSKCTIFRQRSVELNHPTNMAAVMPQKHRVGCELFWQQKLRLEIAIAEAQLAAIIGALSSKSNLTSSTLSAPDQGKFAVRQNILRQLLM